MEHISCLKICQLHIHQAKSNALLLRDLFGEISEKGYLQCFSCICFLPFESKCKNTIFFQINNFFWSTQSHICDGPYTLTAKETEKMKARKEIVSKLYRRRMAFSTIMVTTESVVQNQYASELIQRTIPLKELFKDWSPLVFLPYADKKTDIFPIHRQRNQPHSPPQKGRETNRVRTLCLLRLHLMQPPQSPVISPFKYRL